MSKRAEEYYKNRLKKSARRERTAKFYDLVDFTTQGEILEDYAELRLCEHLRGMRSIQVEIKKEMEEWYGFVLTYGQVIEFLEEYPKAVFFDTEERSLFANYISDKVTGLRWPLNGDSEEYSQKFFSELKEKAGDAGYIWVDE